jgi:hypothetical protein
MCPKYIYKEGVCTRVATPIHHRTPKLKELRGEKTYEVYGNLSKQTASTMSFKSQ